MAKFRGDWPRELGDYALKKKHHEHFISPPVTPYGRPNNFTQSFQSQSLGNDEHYEQPQDSLIAFVKLDARVRPSVVALLHAQLLQD